MKNTCQRNETTFILWITREREKVKSVVVTGTETGHTTVQSDKLFYSIKIRQAIDRDVGLCKSRTSLFILQIKWSCLLKWTSGGIR